MWNILWTKTAAQGTKVKGHSTGKCSLFLQVPFGYTNHPKRKNVPSFVTDCTASMWKTNVRRNMLIRRYHRNHTTESKNWMNSQNINRPILKYKNSNVAPRLGEQNFIKKSNKDWGSKTKKIFCFISLNLGAMLEL